MMIIVIIITLIIMITITIITVIIIMIIITIIRTLTRHKYSPIELGGKRVRPCSVPTPLGGLSSPWNSSSGPATPGFGS